MKLVNPSIEVENYNGVQIMKNIERACRTCYRSEGNITDDSYILDVVSKERGE